MITYSLYAGKRLVSHREHRGPRALIWIAERAIQKLFTK
jgi:hypothetical protein